MYVHVHCMCNDVRSNGEHEPLIAPQAFCHNIRIVKHIIYYTCLIYSSIHMFRYTLAGWLVSQFRSKVTLNLFKHTPADLYQLCTLGCAFAVCTATDTIAKSPLTKLMSNSPTS